MASKSSTSSLGAVLKRLMNWSTSTSWSFKTAPKELVLDFDATDCPLYGKQEDRFFHGHAACPREGGEQLLLPAAACLLWQAERLAAAMT